MFGLFPSALFTSHVGQAGGRGLSPRLWSRVAGQCLSPDGHSNWYFAGDDFTGFGLAASGKYIGSNGLYTGYIDTGNTIAALPSEVGGVARLLTDNTDNDEVWLAPGDGAQVLGKISDAAGEDKTLLFEARIRPNQVTDTRGFFVGMSEEGLAAADTLTDAGALADKDFIGFFSAEGDGDAMSFVYKKAGQTAQTVLTAAITADWVKVGFAYDPKAPASKRITVYIDNVEQSSYVTAAKIAAATFPDGEELNALFGFKNGSGAIHSLDLDWWFFGQAG